MTEGLTTIPLPTQRGDPKVIILYSLLDAGWSSGSSPGS
jgi:hypothetical protein